MRFWDMFVDGVLAHGADRVQERRRIGLLLPVYQMKWITILLNDFHTAGNERRRFARPEENEDRRKVEQLGKARERLNALVV